VPQLQVPQQSQGYQPTDTQKLATGPLGDAAMYILQALQAAAPAPQMWNPQTYHGSGQDITRNILSALLPPNVFPRMMTQGMGMAQDVANRAGFGKDLEAVLAQLPMFRNMGGAGMAMPFRSSPLSNERGVLDPGGVVYHGSPSSVAGSVPLNELGRVYGEMVGAPGPYAITSPEAASAYALGSQSEAGALTKAGQYGPNVRAMQMAPHQSLYTDMPVTGPELNGLIEALQQHYNPAAKLSKGGSVISPEMQRNNLVNSVQSSMIPDVSPGGHLRDVLTGQIGQIAGEDMLSKGGFKSIHYPGEHPSSLGNVGDARAYKVLDNSILTDLADYLANLQKTPQAIP